MTIVGNHLVCDCSKAIKGSTCPRQMISPMISKPNTYFHCPNCNFDFICTQATKVENGLDKFGYPQFKQNICRKCETPLIEKKWPLE